MPNLKSIINSHNHKMIDKVADSNKKSCNCITSQQYPLNQLCLIKNTLHKAVISSDLPNYTDKVYIGISEPPFKLCYANHIKSFNIARYKNDTELSKEVCRIKEKNGKPSIKWSIIKKCLPYQPNKKRCALCLNEKTETATYWDTNLLNKKHELVSKCRHMNKYMLASFDSKD